MKTSIVFANMQVFSLSPLFTPGFTLQGKMSYFKDIGVNEVFSLLFTVY